VDVQKFTRSLTREIAVDGRRFAVTFSAAGLSLRPVGSRKPPREMSWQQLVALLEQAGPEAAPAETTPVTDLLSRLETWLARHRKRFLKAMPPGADAAALEALQTALGRPLPDDLRALLAWHNGQGEGFVGCFWERWYLLSSVQVGETYQQMLREEKDRWRSEWVPFLGDDRDNCVFLDTSQEGPPMREFWQKNPEQPTTAPSLAAWLAEFVSGLEAGQFTEDPDRGHFVRRSDPS
jgi:cell wall assembly regulator SMI1